MQMELCHKQSYSMSCFFSKETVLYCCVHLIARVLNMQLAFLNYYTTEPVVSIGSKLCNVYIITSPVAIYFSAVMR